jgi:hypothetical protein
MKEDYLEGKKQFNLYNSTRKINMVVELGEYRIEEYDGEEVVVFGVEMHLRKDILKILLNDESGDK